MRIIMIRMPSIWWSGILLALTIFCQMPIEASHLTAGVEFAPLQSESGQDSTQIDQQPFGGKLSRRAKAEQRRISMPAANVVAQDTLQSMLEVIHAMPRDSSARIAQFKYERKDEPAVSIAYRKNYPLFLAPPPVVKHQAILDSNRLVYRLCQTYDENDTRISVEIPFEVYTSLRLKQAIRQNWESIIHPFSLEAEKQATLGDLMGKITKIEIPIPKNPIFSIFGKNIIRMNINGSIDISAGFRTQKSDLYTSSPFGQSQTTPDFKQEIQVGVKGEIGDKLKIDADWNTQRTFEYENQLHVRYQGYEDEIIQNVEAGNVSLPTKSSFISGGQALFGIKAQFQLGPLNLTTVATQKKGEIKELSVSGGGKVEPFEVRLTEYSQNHYFIDSVYRSYYETLFQPGQVILTPDMQRTKILDIEVWVTATGQYDALNERYVVAFINSDTVKRYQDSLEARSQYYAPVSDGTRESGRFIKLEQNVDYNCDALAGIISLRKFISADQAIAVNYITAGPPSDTVGNSSRTVKDPNDTLKLVMKLIRPKGLTSSMKQAWGLMLKNRYPLGPVGISQESFEFRIEYQVPGQNAITEVTDKNINLIKLFGLGGDNVTTNENVFNYVKGITIDETRGEVIFPTTEPFRLTSVIQDLKKYNAFTEGDTSQALLLSFGKIYDTTASGAIIDTNNRYYLRGSVKGGLSSDYNLGFNIVEGSVEVISNGQRLISGVDYTVDYISGSVKIRNQLYLMPGHDLQIKYEANDLFQLASKSLLGARGELDLGEKTSLGFTIMKYSQQSLSDKVRLGEEPISNTIMGVDGGTTIEAPWLTNALNNVPGIKSTVASQISLRGEAAYIIPNPNTRTSPIASDGSKGVAYIDDFEGARQIIPLGTFYGMWKDASAPWFVSTIDSSRAIGPNGWSISTSDAQINSGFIQADTTKMYYKAKACWFNVYPTDVTIPSIWGDRRSFAQGEGQITSLDFYFLPAVRGPFNYSMHLDSTIGLGKTEPESHIKAWAGIQRVLSTTSTNLVEQNIESIEFWIKVVSPQDGNTSKLNIDLGYISEDVIPNREINTEDGLDLPNRKTHRGVLNPAYDWGIDMLDNNTEQSVYKNFISKYPQDSLDPSGDNWGQPPTDFLGPFNTDNVKAYLNVNGTEGNYGKSDQGLLPDGEDLNRNDNSDRLNAYFEYEIPLDTTDSVFKNLMIGEGREGSGWYQIRIPLAEFKRKIGEPDLSKVEGVRLWVTGAQKETLFRLVDFNLVGNQWEKRDRADSSFDISVVNIEDNPGYSSPPGVAQQKDLTRPDQNILGNEQSLNIIVKDLRDGEFKEAVKNFKSKPIDMFNYRTMKMFIHGETGRDSVTKHYRTFKYDSAGNHDAEVFVHFGDDINNYYEYRAPVHPGWEGNDVVIKFGDLTAIKAGKRNSLNMTDSIPVVGGPPGATYRVSGNPRLDRIKFISVGIHNTARPDHTAGTDPDSITGELWANELRLTDVDDTPGWAYKFDASISLADYGSIVFSMSERDPFFHGLEDHFGSRTTSKAWSLSTSLNLGKFLPDSWNGTVLSINYSHSESMNKPRYLPGQDILVEEEAKLVAQGGIVPDTVFSSPEDVRIKSEDLNISNSYSVPTIKLNIPLKTWVITETINKMTFGYNYTESKSRSPVTEYSKSWSWNANFRYATDLSLDNYLSLGKSKIFYTPRQLSFGATLNRNQSQSKSRTWKAQNIMSHNLTAQRSMDFNWQFYEGKLFQLGMSYNVNISSSLYFLDADSNNNLRSIWDIFFKDKFLNFGIDQNYSQNIAFNSKISTPSLFKLDKIIILGQPRYSVGYRWNYNIQAGPLGRSAGWSSSPGFSFDVDLKPISEAIWSPSTAPAPADTGKGKSSSNPLQQLDKITRILFKIPFFDFEKFSVSFTQTNTAQNNGVRGNTGFGNIFTRVPFFQSSLWENGPSLLYQLGLSSDPNGYVVLKTKGTFPFITGYTVPGIRAGNASINDIYSQSNQVSLRTSRRLWEGVSLQLDWRVGWSYNESRNGNTDEFGRVTALGKTVTGTIERSYISLPPTFIFKLFNTSMDNVNKKFQELKQQDPDPTHDAANISKAFEQGLEAFPWLTKILGSLAPRANWSIRWDGLEKLSFFESFTKSVSIDHAYSSSYNEGWKMTLQGQKEITNQQVSYGFSPLVGLNITFKELMKGSLSASFQYRTQTNYSLIPTSLNASEGSTSNISITGTYSRKGFEIPLFGLSLSNNIDISFSYSYSHDTKVIYYFSNFQKDGVPDEGLTRTTMRPELSYSLSERVTAKLFYSYTRTAPDAGGSRVPGSTTNEGGLSVRVAIQ